MVGSRLVHLGQKIFAAAVGAKEAAANIAKPVSEIRSIAEMMQAVTGDKRWQEHYNFADGPYASLNIPAHDPAGFATLYAISDLPNFRAIQEELDLGDIYSGRSRVSASSPSGDSGFIQMIGWMKPLGERYQDNSVALERLRDNPRLHNAEIRVLSDEHLVFIKTHYQQIRQKYQEGYKMAAEGGINFGSSALQAGQSSPVLESRPS